MLKLHQGGHDLVVGLKWLLQSRALLFYFLIASNLATFASAGSALGKRSTQISLNSFQFQDDVLSGEIKVQNIEYSKVVSIVYGVGNNWGNPAISAAYSSGPDGGGYEAWKFSGSAAGATQFYIEYKVAGKTYYDPGNSINYQIGGGGGGSPTHPPPTDPPGTPPPISVPPSESLIPWLAAESPIADAFLKRNIGSSNNAQIPKGVIIASPSKSNPDYYYQWTRDSSCVMDYVVGEYVKSGAKGLNLEYVLDWIAAQKVLQRVDNPSGGFRTGGLGEPKFLVDSKAFTGGWGRPQRDGPALRASTLIKFAKKYIETDKSFVTTTLYDSKPTTESVIKADLDYVLSNWNQGGFDLWEERNGKHFFTLIVSYRAMKEGAELAGILGDTASAQKYSSVLGDMEKQINGFWDSGKGYITSTQNDQRQGIDCGTLLGSIRGGGYLFHPSHPQVLATVDSLVSAFQNLYGINKKADKPGVAIGRYPEDVYNGIGTSQASPWFICTATVAHTLYSAASHLKSSKNITINATNGKLFRRLSPGIPDGTYADSTTQYKTLLTNMVGYADTFLAVVKKYADPSGAMSEQFNRDSGVLQGAKDLTWSFEALLGAINERLLAVG